MHYISSIILKNFRIFSENSIKFSPGINVITGNNGQGKTSILEGIYYLSISKSFRVNNDQNVIRYNSDYFEINGKICSGKKDNIRLYYSVKDGKHIFLNKSKIRSTDLLGRYPTVILSLEDLELTYGVPTTRRRFFDILLSQLDVKYLENLKRYKKVISQKNKLLSVYNSSYEDELKAWNRQITEYGSYLVYQRLNFVKFLNDNITTIYRRVSGKEEKIIIKYNSSFGDLESNDPVEKIKILLKDEINKNVKKEINKESSLIGPHRDDIGFYKDDYLIKSFASQGENKTFLISLKFIEALYIKEKTNNYPVILLDDIFGELDKQRITNLSKLLSSLGQVFITTTHNPFSEPDSNHLLIEL